MGFIDEAEITVKSGDGGAGCISFRRERFLPKGGPDGGDGGKGGNVVIKATRRLYSLYDLHSKILFKAQNGRPGRGNNRSGKKGKDIEILVPVGIMVRDQETGELLADLVYDNQHIILVEGGAGGKGNSHFGTAANRAPRFAQEGQKGTEKRLKLELKLVADIGIVGLPNTGKSTLLSRISHAHPKIDKYPFTTVAPNLGVLSFDDEQSLTIADIPGLLHVLDVNQPHSGDVVKDFSILRQELERFHPCLTEKDQVVVINKIDLKPFGKKSIQEICRSFHDLGHECLAISALTGQGVEELRQLLREKVIS
jgi:GTP-binding protein